MQRDSVLQFIKETSSQYNFSPAKMITNDIVWSSSITHLKMAHMHTGAAINVLNCKAPHCMPMYSSIYIIIGNITISNIPNSIAKPPCNTVQFNQTRPHNQQPPPPREHSNPQDNFTILSNITSNSAATPYPTQTIPLHPHDWSPAKYPKYQHSVHK